MIASFITSAGVQVWHQCLFGQGGVLACKYDPSNPTVYLSLGDALAASGLIFAAYQLADKHWKIRHSIHWQYSSLFLWICSLLGIISAVTASLLPQLEIYNRASLFAHPIFWEVLSLVFFVSGVTHYVIVGLFWRKFFGKTNAERFYNTVITQISQIEPQIIIDIVAENLERITSCASKNDAGVNQTTAYACAILECITSEERVLEYLVTHRLDFLFSFVYFAEKLNTDTPGISTAINGIARGLYKHEKSFLYSQLSYQGLSNLASIYDLIFSSPKIFGRIDLFMNWKAYEYPMRLESPQLKEEYLSVFVKSIEYAIKAYYSDRANQGRFAGTHYFFNHAFEQLLSYCSFASNPAIEKTKYLEIVIRQRFGTIAHLLGHDFLYAYTGSARAGNLTQEEKIPLFDQYKNGINLSGLYIESMIDFMDKLSRYDRRETDEASRYQQREDARLLAHDAFYQLVNDSDPLLTDLRTAFLDRTWEEIERSVEDGGYPALSSVYFWLVNWHEPKGREVLEYEKARGFLYEKLLPKIKKREKMSNRKDDKGRAHLPPQLVYSKKKGTFEYHYLSSVVVIPDPKVVPPSDAPVVQGVST